MLACPRVFKGFFLAHTVQIFFLIQQEVGRCCRTRLVCSCFCLNFNDEDDYGKLLFILL